MPSVEPTPARDRWQLGRRPALDGLRAIAVLLVILDHLKLGPFHTAGTMGVAMFFTLSGFLITSLLVAERDRSGRIDMVAFTQRRVIRLVPALVFFLAAMWLFRLASGVDRLATLGGTVASMLFIGNWVALEQWMYGLQHTWSLAVEEQFYLLWPLIFILVRTRRAAIVAATAGIGWSVWRTVEMAMEHERGFRIYVGLDTRASQLLIGCLLALVMAGLRDRGARSWLSWAPLLPLVFFMSVEGQKQFFLPALVASIATAVVIWGVAQGDYRGWLTHPWLRYVGQRSYGLYLWHHPFLIILAPLAPEGLRIPAALGLLALSWLCTEASWRYVEQPVSKWGRARLAASRAAAAEAATTRSGKVVHHQTSLVATRLAHALR